MLEQNSRGVGLGAVPIIGALTALAIPLVSGAFLVLAIFLILPYTAFVPVVVIGLAANVANFLLSVRVLRFPGVLSRVRALLRTAAIFSAIYLAALTFLLAWVSKLGL